MPRKLFDVTDYDIEDLFIVAELKRGTKEKTEYIIRQQFEDWMARTGRLELDDYRGQTRTWTIEEYYNCSGSDQVKHDIYEFIICQLYWKETMQNPFKAANAVQLAEAVLN